MLRVSEGGAEIPLYAATRCGRTGRAPEGVRQQKIKPERACNNKHRETPHKETLLAIYGFILVCMGRKIARCCCDVMKTRSCFDSGDWRVGSFLFEGVQGGFTRGEPGGEAVAKVNRGPRVPVVALFRHCI